MDACCVLCVSVYMRAPVSTVIPPRYWWCVALFIAASPLSRRREPLHTNRPLVRWRRGGSLSLYLSLSLSHSRSLVSHLRRKRERGRARLRARTPRACAMWKSIMRSRRDVRMYVRTPVAECTGGFFTTPERRR